MTKQEYNDNLERFHKAMAWYDTNPSIAEQEKFLGNFIQVLEKLKDGYNELKPKGTQVLWGFKI